MSASSIATHPGRKPAKLDDYRTRTRPQLLQEPAAPRSEIARRLNEIMADFEKPSLAVVRDNPRDSHYWRKLEHENQNRLRQADCPCCKGTGEIWVWIDYPPDPCPNCQPAYVRGPVDDAFIF